MKSIRAKIFTLVLVPLFVVVLVITGISMQELSKMGAKDVSSFKQQLLEVKKEELKNYILIAKKSVQGLSPEKEGDLTIMRDRIRQLNFGKNGYFFVFDKDSVTVVHGGKPSLEGKDLSKLKDTRGLFIIQELVKVALDGGDFVEYFWDNPATKSEGLKLSYADMLSQWGYMIGIGIYIDDIDAKVSVMEGQVKENLNNVLYKAIIAASLILLACIVMVLFITPKITKPLLFVAESLKQIAEGGGDLTQRIDIKSKDEAGKVASSFNQFVGMIQELVSEIRESTNNLNSTMAELELLREKGTKRIISQVDHRNSVVDGINELMMSADDISQSSVQATEEAKNATIEAEHGITGLRENSDQIKQLAEDINTASGVISELETEVASIGTVLNVIQEIAEQTNLLALNAAIEAARAGDQGRGFAVVADEVRALAARTRKSTEEIHNMIQRLEDRSQSAVTVMNSSQARSVATAEHANTVIERLSHLNTIINNINEINTKIELTSINQNSMTSQMNDNIAIISELGAESVEDDEKSAVHTQGVAAQTEHLYELVGKFKV
jgi:methyl-accepting chemotaxis protein